MDKKNILIIEDERNLGRTLAQALRVGLDRHFEVETCESGEEAFHKLYEKDYSLIISDLRLPGIDGLELITYIKRFFSDTHVILITGFGSDEVEARADQITEGHLTKPFDILDLLRMVQKVIDPRHKKNGAFLKDDLTNDTPHRILILYKLSEHPHNVSDLAAELELHQPTTSRHLKVLRDRGIVVAQRDGQSMFYSLADRRIIKALDLLRAVLADTLETQIALARTANESFGNFD